MSRDHFSIGADDPPRIGRSRTVERIPPVVAAGGYERADDLSTGARRSGLRPDPEGRRVQRTASLLWPARKQVQLRVGPHQWFNVSDETPPRQAAAFIKESVCEVKFHA